MRLQVSRSGYFKFRKSIFRKAVSPYYQKFNECKGDDVLGALCVFLVAACGFDYRCNKIPNFLILVIAVVGALQQWVTGGLAEVLCYLGTAVLVAGMLYPLFKIGSLGAGDVKLLGVTAGYLPFKKIMVFLFISLLIAALISLVKMWKRNNFLERLRYLMAYLADVMRSGNFRLYLENEADKQAVGICLSGPVLLAVLLYCGGVY